MNEEKKINRKDWIKNVAIIFLAVMLVLTFFSNTILNYSLPEVATVMIQSGSVTSRIRGTGTLAADDPYKVTIQESRVVASVAVKAGETVEKGQVLFYLEDKQSEELKAAEEKLRVAEAELDALVLAYSTALLKGEVSAQSYQNIQSGIISTDNTYQARIEMAKQKVTDAQATVDSLSRQIAIVGTNTGTSTNKSAELANAQAALENAKTNVANIQAQLEAANSNYSVSNNATQAAENLTVARTVQSEKENAYKTALKEFQTAMDNGLSNIGEPGITVQDLSTQADWQAYLTSLQTTYIEKFNNSGSNPDDLNESANYKLKASDKFLLLKVAYEAYLAAQTDFVKAQNQYNYSMNLPSEISRLQTALTNAQNYQQECVALINRLQAESTNSTNTLNQQKAQLETAKINAEAALKQAQTELNQLLTDVSKELDFSGQNEVIRLKQEEVGRRRADVEELIEKSQGTTIVAPVAGTVTSVNITAGETTSPDKEVAVMQPTGKGFSLSFSVTNDQAQKVSVGDPVELQNAWYYNDITASLTAIRPDPQNPGQNRLLVFSVAGDVQAGQSLSLVVGQRSANYDMIVPNSAIREDNNGKFILVVESRNSPLGNRYVATRTNVEVLASDEVNSAISGSLYGYEYVITTATKPVEAGREVRLAENN